MYESSSYGTLAHCFTNYTQKPSDCLCDFPGHQILKFDLYFQHSVRPPLVIQDFTFSVVFLRAIEAVLKPDLIQFGPKTGYSARNIGVVRDYSIAAQIVAVTRLIMLIDIRQRTPGARPHRPKIHIHASHHQRQIHASSVASHHLRPNPTPPADHDRINTPGASFHPQYLRMFII